MKKPHGSKSRSMLVRILAPMSIIMVLQAALFYSTILGGGTIEEMRENSLDILNERVINRKSYLQNEMLQRWSNIGESVDIINSKVFNTLQSQGKTYADISLNSSLATELLEETSNQLIYMLRKNNVTGTYLILSGQDRSAVADKPREYSGVCIRNMNPEYSTQDNSDLLIEKAPASVCKALGISMDSWWEPQFHLKTGSSADFYYQPYSQAIKSPELGWKNLGYWSRTHRLSGQDPAVISYSVPLIGNGGEVYGILGVELSQDYLRKLMDYKEIDANRVGAYVMGMDSEGNNSFSPVLSSGPAYSQLFGDDEAVCLKTEPLDGQNYNVILDDKDKGKVVANVQYITMYNNNTPFDHERWALIGVLRERDLFASVGKVTSMMLISMSVSLFAGLIAALAVGSLTTRPVTSLVQQLKKSNPRRPVELDKINISEIDELASAIEQLSNKVADSASKLSQIIKIANVEIGAFEYNVNQGEINFSGSLVQMLGLVPDSFGQVSKKEFSDRILELEQDLEEDAVDKNLRVYCTKTPNGKHWLRMKLAIGEGQILGVLTDITQEMLEKRKIEFERDYDVLTSLLNRRAFRRVMQKKFERPELLGVAAMIMMDLDNLKYINDTYGHDCGDAYIQSAANVLSKMSNGQSVVARMSGDEFLMLLYGYKTQEEIRTRVEEIKNELRVATLVLPNGELFKVRASAGVAWYPADAVDYEQLIHYADFAMYRVKNTTKGEFNEFDSESYNRDSYLLSGKEELNKLIDEELVEYHFQPIVSAVDGRIYAYEALMRSKQSSLKSPLEILSMAKSQSKLYQIERLTWFLAMEAYENNRQYMEGCKVFINSIPNQVLSSGDMAYFGQRFAPYLTNLVVELTEEEKLDEEFTRRKQQSIRAWHGMLALDDFGTGYNGESVLLTLTPNFVKLDMSLVRDVDTDVGKQKLMLNLVSYAKMNGIKVIAEGIETRGELETVIKLGADYLQGFYLGRPALVPQGIGLEVEDEIVEIHQR